MSATMMITDVRAGIVLERDEDASWDLVAQYKCLAENLLASEEQEPARAVRERQKAKRGMAPAVDPVSLPWEPMARYNALAKQLRTRRGNKTVEHLEVLRTSNPCYGSLLPSQERVAKHELSYEPSKRWTAMSPMLRQPRGAKSVKHLEVLRTSNPCFGSLLPSQERVAKHELSYEPSKRWTAMSSMLRQPRGAKSVEHLEVLRTSNPCYGSLLPAEERTGKHELPYRPERRYIALAALQREPRGAKTFAHLKNLRIDAPRSAQPSHYSPTRGDSSPDEDEAEVGEEAAELPRPRISLSRLPRIASQQLFVPEEEEDEDALSYYSTSPGARSAAGRAAPAWMPPAPIRSAHYPQPVVRSLAMRRISRDSADEPDDASLFSAARTSLERGSNDTIASFLDDEDGSASGEWSMHAVKEARREPPGAGRARDEAARGRDGGRGAIRGRAC